MPWSIEPTVIHHNGYDYWRTWFIEECEKHLLFGIREYHIDIIINDQLPYRLNTKIFLEDAPFFTNTNEKLHRVCGPYEVMSTETPPSSATIIKIIDESIIVYKDLQPSRGPWRNRRNCLRIVDNQVLHYQQLASQYDYFPFRFKIRRAENWRSRIIEHKQNYCWLCL